MRFLYLLYTAKIHEDGDGYLDVLEKMTRLQVDGQTVETNQYLTKAKILDLMILMNQLT
jgi:hypothetical protein